MPNRKPPKIQVERDASLKCYEVNIWLEDESNYCQVLMFDDGTFLYKGKQAIDDSVRQYAREVR